MADKNEAAFKVGDPVLVNYSQIATITSWDESNDWYSAEVKVAGATNTLSGHISNTVFQSIGPEIAKAVVDGRQDKTRDGVTNVGDDD